jgi:hypothetical protein
VLLAAIPLTLMIPEMPREERSGEDRSSGARQTAPAEASRGVPASTP